MFAYLVLLVNQHRNLYYVIPAADNTMEAEMYARRDNPDLYVVETVKYRWIDN